MRMIRALGLAGAIVLGAVAHLPASSAIHHAIAPDMGGRTVGSARRAKRALASTAARYRRSRNAPHRRSLRANRLHVSRRTRRRHRRARAA
jgi:hypothetical protein